MNALPHPALIDDVLAQLSPLTSGREHSLLNHYDAIMEVDPDGAPQPWIDWLNTRVPWASSTDNLKRAWEWHDLLVVVVERNRRQSAAWGLALLDHGVESMLQDMTRGGGQALRSALDLPDTSRELVERLWAQMVDPQPMLDVLRDRISGSASTNSNRYTCIADQVLTRLAGEGRQLDLVQDLAATIGPERLPLFEHWRRTQARLHFLNQTSPGLQRPQKPRVRS